MRTPLTLALSPTESLLTGDYGPLTPKQGQALEIIHNNNLRLLQMVTGLLDFSKLEAGKLPVKREPLNVAAITHGILEDFRPLAAQKSLSLVFHSSVPQMTLEMDRYLYERILFNLLSNAVKFTAEGGLVEVNLNYADEQLALQVRDTGLGIAQEDVAKLFQKFRQLEGSSTRRFEGSGLGLALVKEFAGLLEGNVRVESELGRGSAFTVTCKAPMAGPAAPTVEEQRWPRFHLAQRFETAERVVAATEEKEALVKPGVIKPKVLVAEDNVELAAYIDSLLSDFCEVKRVRDGAEAWAAVQNWRPEVVLSDVMMPKLDGFSLCREMKRHNATAKIPIVLLTALTHRDALLQGWEAGADEYLYKPFHPKELQTRIRSLLGHVQNHKRLERELIRRTASIVKVQSELKQLELLAFISSHDLQEPLRRIAAFSELIQYNLDEARDTPIADYLDRLKRNVFRIKQYIEDLAVFSQVAQQTTPFERVALKEIVKQVLDELEKEIRTTGAVVQIEDLPEVHADPEQMKILFRHLLDNALKFRQPEGAPQIVIRHLSGNKRFTRIAIQDRGIGFDAKYRKQIFQPFKRLHLASEFEGTGMGLAICRRIVTRHGGRLFARSLPGNGTTLFVHLPQNGSSTAPQYAQG